MTQIIVTETIVVRDMHKVLSFGIWYPTSTACHIASTIHSPHQVKVIFSSEVGPGRVDGDAILFKACQSVWQGCLKNRTGETFYFSARNVEFSQLKLSLHSSSSNSKEDL